MGIFCSCSKLQENENNLVHNSNNDTNIFTPLNTAFCTHSRDQNRGLGQQGFKCIQCESHKNKNLHQLGKNCTNDSVVSDDSEEDCQSSSSTLCSDTTLADIKGFSHQNDIIDQPADSVLIKHPEADDAEVGLSCQYSIDDFDPMKIIGRGSYSDVLVVKHKRNQRFYAMKVMEKDRINRSRNENTNWVQTERNVFIAVSNYPFFVSLHCCFQTASRLFFVMEFVRGGDLLSYMERKKMLSEDHARFYAAEICLALNFLHTRGIIYRDLKLENVLLDHEGHIKLADYGMCKQVKWPGEKTYEFCGTPNYMAPEMIKNEPYGFSVDWWALGVLLYEMLVGKCPFNIRKTTNNEKYSTKYIFRAILNNPLFIPKFLSENAASILEELLNKNPSNRLGEEKGFDDVKDHMFFKSIEWKILEQKRVSPYDIPQLESNYDLTYFSTEFTYETINCITDENDFIDQSKFIDFEYVNPVSI